VAIVDDEESVRRAMGRLIRSAGIDVETFPSGAEFLQSLESHSPDCVVLDLHMPGLSGFEVQARLKESQSRVPIVVITGHDTDESRERVTRAGVAAYLSKPVDEKILLDTISAAVACASGGESPS
jgi:FixJ family two-component response regulator